MFRAPFKHPLQLPFQILRFLYTFYKDVLMLLGVGFGALHSSSAVLGLSASASAYVRLRLKLRFRGFPGAAWDFGTLVALGVRAN